MKGRLARASGRTVTADQRARFLKALSETGNVTLSAAAINVHRVSVYDWCKQDAEFKAAFDAAIEQATDALEAEARRRAMLGTEEYLTSRDGLIRDRDGNPVMQKRYSDTLMALLLKAYRPERFRERTSVELDVGADLAALIEEGRRRAREE